MFSPLRFGQWQPWLLNDLGHLIFLVIKNKPINKKTPVDFIFHVLIFR